MVKFCLQILICNVLSNTVYYTILSGASPKFRLGENNISKITQQNIFKILKSLYKILTKTLVNFT